MLQENHHQAIAVDRLNRNCSRNPAGFAPIAIVTVPREVKEPVELIGYQLEPGMRLYGCIYLTHQRPNLYPEPRSFNPERFLARQFSPYEFLPFGGGTRRCIGEALAQFEMKLVLATLLSQ